MSNNAWTNSGAGPRQPPGSQPNAVASQGSAAPRFNAQEVRDCLKNAFRNGDATFTPYKALGGPSNSNARSGGAWPSKPNNMNNNKDFYTELRKQVSAMQQGGERAGG
ncbi:hypothetical protein JMJ35_001479 [Cladonia borealis]|uniref:Uncharacterized protein n=1 Tax=Cladonia borealis TaxID=184061 RepID=A0AA39V9G0_9LECA|nr:hypothetical protein JMJ35_001479 [Cladonia borealis]